jgi:hypothetical protein
MPAWMMSLALHLVLMLTLALALPAGAPSAPTEPPRDVGIVVAQRRDEEKFLYSDEQQTEAAETDQAQTSEPAATPPSGGPRDGEPALPTGANAAALLIPDIQLPGAAVAGGAPDGLLVPDLKLSGAGRRPILPSSDEEAILAEQAARQAARAAIAPPTRVSVFGSAPAEGRSFVFAIDRSKSMGGDGLNALAAARSELARAVLHLTGRHRFQIIAYNHTCVYYKTTRLIAASEENRAGIPAFIDGLADFGGTAHEMVLRAALGMEPEAVFLLTDGGDPHLNDIQLKNIQKLAQGRTTIHCIQFGFGAPGEGESFLRQLAEQNGGGYTYVEMSKRRE